MNYKLPSKPTMSFAIAGILEYTPVACHKICIIINEHVNLLMFRITNINAISMELKLGILRDTFNCYIRDQANAMPGFGEFIYKIFNISFTHLIEL